MKSAALPEAYDDSRKSAPERPVVPAWCGSCPGAAHLWKSSDPDSAYEATGSRHAILPSVRCSRSRHVHSSHGPRRLDDHDAGLRVARIGSPGAPTAKDRHRCLHSPTGICAGRTTLRRPRSAACYHRRTSIIPHLRTLGLIRVRPNDRSDLVSRPVDRRSETDNAICPRWLRDAASLEEESLCSES